MCTGRSSNIDFRCSEPTAAQLGLRTQCFRCNLVEMCCPLQMEGERYPLC